MLEKIKNIRRKIGEHDLTFWEFLPCLVALIIPNLLEPAWIYRLVSFFVASLAFFIICIHGVLAPEQIFKAKYSQLPRRKIKLFWLLSVIGVLSLPLVLFFAVIPASSDLYRTIKNPEQALEEKVVTIIRTEYGGSLSPYFILQRLITDDNKTYHLPFSAHAWGPGTYMIIYSEYTDTVYEVIPGR
jgi:hypothetical protein